MEIKNSSKCYLCKNLEETIEHLYWYCELTQTPNKLLIKHKIIYDHPWDPITILLGLDAEGTTSEIPQIVHIILVVTQRYIHNCKCHNTNISIQGLIHKIREIEKMEYIIANTKSGKGN